MNKQYCSRLPRKIETIDKAGTVYKVTCHNSEETYTSKTKNCKKNRRKNGAKSENSDSESFEKSHYQKRPALVMLHLKNIIQQNCIQNLSHIYNHIIHIISFHLIQVFAPCYKPCK